MTIAPAAETHYYQDAGVTVTNARFITRGHTIVMSGVTSVQAVKEKTGLLVWLMVLAGLFLLFGVEGISAKLIGLILAALGIYRIVKPTYVLWLTSSSGRSRAFADRNSKRILAIAEAVNQAIIGRG